MTAVGDTTNTTSVRALINPNRLKQDYDDKIIPIGYEHQFKPVMFLSGIILEPTG